MFNCNLRCERVKTISRSLQTVICFVYICMCCNPGILIYYPFMFSVLGILVLSGLILLPVLLPVAATDHSIKLNNTTSNGTFDDFDKLSMGHVGVRMLHCVLFS